MRHSIACLIVALSFVNIEYAHAERTARGGSSFMDAVAEGVRQVFRTSGQTLEYSERGGRRRNSNLISVNGCSNSSTFQTFYGNPGGTRTRRGRQSRGPACDRNLTMNRHYADFVNKNLEACAVRAADNAFGAGEVSPTNGANAVYHHGCMGDANHQHTGSWHNEGMAWDVTALQIGGRVIKYSDALKDRKTASFYEHFRKCWGERVAANGRTCRQAGKKGRPAGTIGNEDRRHRSHLHLSLPCRALSNGRATFTAGYPFFELLFPSAHADEMENEPELMEAESQFFTSQLRMAQGLIEVEVEDAGGEPINEDTMISLTLACNRADDIVSLESGLPSCAFDGLKPVGNGQVVLSYRTAKMVDGAVSCSVPQTKQYQVSCVR